MSRKSRKSSGNSAGSYVLTRSYTLKLQSAVNASRANFVLIRKPEGTLELGGPAKVFGKANAVADFSRQVGPLGLHQLVKPRTFDNNNFKGRLPANCFESKSVK